MPSLDQQFVSLLCQMAERNKLSMGWSIGPSDQFHVQAVHFDNDADWGEAVTIDLYLIRTNTDIEGTAVDIEPRPKELEQ